MRRTGILAVVICGLLAAPAAAQIPPIPTVIPPVPTVPPIGEQGPEPQAYQANDGKGFRDILPSGTRGLYNAPQLAVFLATGATQPHCCDQLGMYGDLVYATPGLQASGDPEVLQGLELRRARRPGRAPLLPARGRDDPARQGLRRPARVRQDARRRDVRARLRRRRGPPLLHGRAAQRRPRPPLELRRRRQHQPGRGAVGGRALHRGRPPAADQAAAGLPGRARRHDLLRRRQLHRRHQPVHQRGEARPDEDAGRVRRARPPAGAGAVEAHRPRRGRVARRRDLRQGRRQRDRVDRGQARARRSLQEEEARQGRVQGLPLGRGSRGADHRARQEALHLPGAAEEAGEGLAGDLPARHAQAGAGGGAQVGRPREREQRREEPPSAACSRSRRRPPTRCSSRRASRPTASR